MIGRNHPLLKTIVPDVSEIVLPRREIIKAIDRAPLNELVYLTAPYGCGKTLSVISWLREHKKSAAWVSLCNGDESPDTLWTLLTGSVLRLAGEHEKAESVLNGTHSVENVFAFLGETLKQVSPKLKDKMVLIVDDCSVLHNCQALHDLKNTICNMLGCWRVIFIGRGELPPVFNDLIMKKCLCQITMNDLSFMLEETTEYFNMNGHAVAKNDLARIHEETDGWPAALNAILSTPHNGILRYGFSAREVIVDYIETEIWEPLDEETKTFLMKTSILDKLTPSICHSITGVEESLPVLRKLYANGLFLSKLEEFNSFCYHRVFKDFLLHKLKKALDTDNINSLYIKVGWWLYERNESISALLCFFKVRNIDGINQAFKKVYPSEMGMDKYVEAASCLTSLDVNELKEYPEVAARIALLFFITNDIEKMQQIYELILEWLEPGALSIPPESYADLSWEVGWLRYVNPDVDILFNDYFEKWANVGEYAPRLLESDRSRAAALRLPSLLRGARDYSVDIQRVEQYYDWICKNGIITDEDGLFIIDLIIAEIAYEREDYNKAEGLVIKILSQIEIARQTELYFTCTMLLVKIRRASHNIKEIDKLIERLGIMIEKNNHQYLLPNFHAFELRSRLADGKPGSNEMFEKENKPYEDKTYYYLIYRHITIVRVLLSESEYSQAIIMLGRLALLCQQYKRNMDLIEVNILRAIAEYGLEHEDNAREHILAALDAGRKSGFIRIFADDAAYLWPILNLIHKNDVDEYTENVILSCKKMMPRMIMAKNADSLSKAEREVYKLLETNMSRKEIARTRKVKLSTIDSQINAIYEKLGVNKRESAVALALKKKRADS